MKRNLPLFRALCLLALAGAADALHAQSAPANDNWANATSVPSVTAAAPFSIQIPNLNLATTESSDPAVTCKNPGFASPAATAISSAEVQTGNSVWFSYTTGAAVEYVNLKATEATFTVAGGFDTVISVWTGTPSGGFQMVTGGCNDDGIPFSTNNNFSRIAGLRLQPNTTYSIMVSFNPAMVPPSTSVLKFDMAAATQILVNTLTDPVPINVSTWPVPPTVTGNPCLDPALIPNNQCSLRAAVETAAILGEQSPNAATGVNGAAILLPAGTYPISVYPAPAPTNDNRSQNVGGGDIDLWGSVGIYGAGMGQTILVAPVGGASAGQYDRVFGITSPIFNGAAAVPGITSNWQRFQRVATVVADLSLQGPGPSAATFVPVPTAPSSSGLFAGGGAFNAFERVEFNGGYAIGNGGAISSGIGLQVRQCKFLNNTATFFNANTTGTGGAINHSLTNDFQFIEVRDSTFSGNFATSDTATSTGVTGGGAILAQGELSLVNSTLSGNATNGYGGAVLISRLGGGEPIADIRNSTIVNNNANANGDSVGTGGGVYLDAASSLNSPATPSITTPALPTTHTIVNSIVANNTVHGDGSGANNNCSATPYAIGAAQVLLSASYDLVNVAGTGVCAFGGSGNMLGFDPQLLSLADNGGPTPTRAPSPGSVAIDAGDVAGCKDHFGRALNSDQRGSVRPTGARCDIGAYELVAIASAPGTPVLAAASDTGDSNSDDLTTATHPLFNGSCGTNGDMVTLVVDNGAALDSSACSGGSYAIAVGTALHEGAHTFSAFESNSNGPSPQSSSLSVTVDLTGPAIALVQTPPAFETGSQDAEFAFTVAEGRLATSQCLLDGAAVADDGCNTGDAQYFSLAVGQHTFSVQATDAAGAISTAQYTWQIGLPSTPAQPQLTAATDSGVSSSDGITNADPIVLHDTCVNGDSLQLYAASSAIGSAAVCTSGSVDISVSGLAEGTYAITMTATRGGTESAHSAARTVTIDRTAPVLGIDSAPQANMVSSSASFAFHDDDGSTMQCQLDAAPVAACTSPQTYNGLALGAHRFTLTATDTAGNGAIAQIVSWSVIQPPASGAPMLAPASDSGRSDSDGITDAVDTTFAGACTDGDSIRLYDAATAVGSPVVCASGVYNIMWSNPAEGSHAIAMTATRNGIESSPSAQTTVVIDRTAPNAPAISGSNGVPALSASLSGLAEPQSLVVVRDGGVAVCSATADADANWTCSGPLAGSGARTLTATATDVAGNTSAASAAFSILATGNDRVFRDGFDD